MRSHGSVLSFVLFLSFFFFALSAHDTNAAGYPLHPGLWMGVTVMDAGSAASGDRSAYRKGVVVADVVKGGPAEKAGLNPSDVIVGINGREIYGVADFVTEIRSLGAGAPLLVEIDRNGVVQTIDVLLTNKSAGLFARGGSYPIVKGGAGCAGDRPGGCVGYGAMEGHGGHTGNFGMPGGSKYGKMYFVRMMHILGLDTEQKKQAGALEMAYRKQTIKLGSRIRLAEVELEELSSPERVDMNRLRAKIDEIAGVAAELRFMRFKSLEDFKGILTPAQREKMRKLSLMGSARGSEPWPASMGVEVYGSKDCARPWRGGTGYMEEPAQLR